MDYKVQDKAIKKSWQQKAILLQCSPPALLKREAFMNLREAHFTKETLK